MRKNPFILCILLVLTAFCFPGCKKDKPLSLESNIILYNKPLLMIRAYIQGRWKCIYGKGGISASNVQYYDDYYWTFTGRDRVTQSYKGNIVTNTSIKWIWDKGTFTDRASTFTMKFYDNQNVPWVYVVDRIVDDTLIIHDNSSDAIFHHLVRF